MSKKISDKEQKKEKKQKKVKIKAGRLARREAWMGVIFISPWIVGALMFLLYPMIESFDFALNNIRITAMGMRFTPVGYGNFTQILLSNPEFVPNLVNYVVSTVISVPVIVVFALIISIMLNQNIKGKGIFRLIFFLPVIIVSGPILNMLNAEGAGSITALDTQAITTAINGFLPSMLAKPISGLFESMITILWYSGVQILIFLSSLQKIDPAMYEAAKIDGGSGWECFWKITLPTIKPMILLNLVYTIVFISNNDTNPIIGLIKTSMFSGSTEMGYGYASAMAWLYSVVELLLVGLFALLFMAKKDVYAKQVKKAKKQKKKDEREIRRVRRRSARNAAKQARAESK